jgi:hypothetical protein
VQRVAACVVHAPLPRRGLFAGEVTRTNALRVNSETPSVNRSVAAAARSSRSGAQLAQPADERASPKRRRGRCVVVCDHPDPRTRTGSPATEWANPPDYPANTRRRQHQQPPITGEDPRLEVEGLRSVSLVLAATAGSAAWTAILQDDWVHRSH